MKKWMSAFVVGLVAAGAARPAAAITDEEIFRTFRFNFVNPGGRAGAMGGAFIGIADDATAAAANPAGLTNLAFTELFTEFRLEDAEPTSLVGLVGDPRGGAKQVTTRSAGSPENALFPSFISFVKPFEHWWLGISRQELLHVDLDALNVFTDENVAPVTTIALAEGRMDALAEQYNVSAAFNAGDKVSLGVTGSYSRLNVESRMDNKFNYGAGLTDDYATAIDDSDEALSFSVGVTWKPIDPLAIGAVYRTGPKFELEERILDTRPPANYPSAGLLADFLGNRNVSALAGAPFGINPATFDDPLEFRNVFKIPDQAGIGFGFTTAKDDRLTLAADLVWVQYSDLEEGFVGNVNTLTFPGDPLTCDLSSPQPDGSFPCDHGTAIASYKVDDELIWHLGIEYALIAKEELTLFVRGGVYNDPNPRLEATFGPGGVFIAENGTFPDGDGAPHYTVGFGFAKGNLQLDFAADLSKLSNAYVASVIYRP